MAKDKREKYLKKKGAKKAKPLSFSKTNYLIFGAAVLILILGYVAMAQPPVDSFMSLTVAPILLVIGYCVLVPLAILWKPRQKNQDERA